MTYPRINDVNGDHIFSSGRYLVQRADDTYLGVVYCGDCAAMLVAAKAELDGSDHMELRLHLQPDAESTCSHIM